MVGGEVEVEAGIAALVSLAVALALPVPARADEMLRIAVATAQVRVLLSGTGLSASLLGDGQAARAVGDQAEVILRGEELVVAGGASDAPGALFRADGPIRIGSLSLPGEVEVRRGAGGLDVIHAVAMEDYVAAVVEAEMPLGFPPEALKAQAVAARSFALAKKLEALSEGRGWHLGSTVLDQVYRAGTDPRARAAAEATAGEVLAFEHEPVLAFFHSSCGGRTAGGAEALGRDLPYLVSVRCGRCEDAPRQRWTVDVPAAELGRLAGLPGPVTGVQAAARGPSGRVASLALSSGTARVALSGADLRQRLGYERLPSLAFEVHGGRRGVVFAGRGAGHGAGLCQWGAAGFARRGKGYREILAHYYPGTDVVRMY
jgi:stage II sporulation protein D